MVEWLRCLLGSYEDLSLNLQKLQKAGHGSAYLKSSALVVRWEADAGAKPAGVCYAAVNRGPVSSKKKVEDQHI